MRKFQIIGNVVRDAEVKQISAQRSVINFTVAVNERWKDAQGNKQEKAHFIQCAIWRENAAVAQYILRGVKIYLEGTPDVGAYINKEGKAIGTLTMNVRELEFLSSVKREGQPAAQPQEEPGLMPTPDDDLPF
jgi:single-strand DNA-binding protein